MSLKLKNASASQFPPGGWGFRDPKTGMIFNGWEGSPQMIAVKVAAHRGANPKLYPDGTGQDQNAIIQEIFAQKVQTHPHLFVGYPDQGPAAYPSQPKQEPLIVKGEKCSCGSTEYEAVFCKTCSGRRVTGYTCKACGKSK